jgi:geranylgeranyl diphosphate synthase type II
MGRLEAESCLERAFGWITGPTTPPRLEAAMRDAVFGGGGRVRPKLVLAVSKACGRGDPAVAEAAAAAVEFLHCASLVHDDLPCFDDAPLRRGKPTVHVAHGEPLAVLVGDALIAGAFEVLGRGCESQPHMLAPLLATVARSVGAVRGIVAGQAWESEPSPNLRLYHRAKTGALFEAAVCAGAIAGGGDPAAWLPVGSRLGEAYQVADDILDLVGSAEALGKPVGQDTRNDRPSAVRELGMPRAYDRLQSLCDSMFTCVPPVEGRQAFVHWAMQLCKALFPCAQQPTLRVENEGFLTA